MNRSFAEKERSADGLVDKFNVNPALTGEDEVSPLTV
jgi:hypothetical protein